MNDKKHKKNKVRGGYNIKSVYLGDILIWRAIKWEIDCFRLSGNTLLGFSEKGEKLIIENGGHLDLSVLPVTINKIGVSAFEKKGLKSLVLSSSITEIGRFAFNSNNIKNVNINDTVKRIDDYAFNNNLIESIKIGKNCYYIGESAFFNSRFKEVHIPKLCTYTGAFDYDVQVHKY